MEFLGQIVYWHWLVLGLFFIGLEMLEGSGNFVWLGISALVVSLIQFFAPSLPWLAQIVIFAASAIVSIYFWKSYKKANPDKDNFPTLNQRGSNYIDRVVTLSEAIVDGEGKVNVSDTIWKVRGPDTAAGTKVKIRAVDGTSLIVEPVAN